MVQGTHGVSVQGPSWRLIAGGDGSSRSGTAILRVYYH